MGLKASFFPRAFQWRSSITLLNPEISLRHVCNHGAYKTCTSWALYEHWKKGKASPSKVIFDVPHCMYPCKPHSDVCAALCFACSCNAVLGVRSAKFVYVPFPTLTVSPPDWALKCSLNYYTYEGGKWDSSSFLLLARLSHTFISF